MKTRNEHTNKQLTSNPMRRTRIEGTYLKPDEEDNKTRHKQINEQLTSNQKSETKKA